MDSPFMQCVQCIFENTWDMVKSVEYPGTGVSIAAIVIGVFLAGLAIRIIGYIFGFAIDATGTFSAGKNLHDSVRDERMGPGWKK